MSNNNKNVKEVILVQFDVLSRKDGINNVQKRYLRKTEKNT
jgi:hypothetical protein